jgi:HEAT repeat protein
MSIITADQYNQTPVYELLAAAAMGHIGVDQRLMRSIVDRGEAAVAEVVTFGLEDHLDDRIALDDDIIAILQYTGSPAGLPYLIGLLRDNPEDPAEDLVHAFLRIGEPAIQPLLDLYEELGPADGSDVAFILASFRQRDERILAMLRARMVADPGDAAFLMGVHGDPAARPLLEQLKASVRGNEQLARTVGSEPDEALALLDHEAPEEAPDPVSLWDIYPEYIEPVFDVMSLEEKIQFLRSKSAEYRADCATSFIDREVPDEVMRILFELAERDPNVGVRSVACTALGGRIEEPKVVNLLLGKLKDGSKPAPERCGALLGMASKAKEMPEIRRYLDEFYANPATIARAMEAMWRSLDERYADHFRRHLDDADFDVRRQAIKGVGFLELSSEAPRIKEMFSDEEFRLDALFTYAMCAPIAKVTRGDIPQLMKKIEDLAGGLSEAEGEVVETALDTRLVLHGLEPVFLNYGDDEDENSEA